MYRQKKNRKQKSERQLYVCFKQSTGDIVRKNSFIWPRKGCLKRETESLLKEPKTTRYGPIKLIGKLTIYNRISTVGYMEKEIKRLIT